jgi:hypothetical protein
MVASKIVPITGRFKNRVIRDVAGSVTAGLILANVFWYGFSVPKFQTFAKYDAKVKAKAMEEEAAWISETNYSRQ